MSLLKIKPFSIDAVETFTFANANIVANLTSGNANLGNLASANFFSGNGSSLYSITGANVTGQVANATVAGTVYTASQPNITSVGTLTSLTVSGATDLGAVANVKITGGTANYVLKTDGAGNLSWASMASGTGNANVAGSNTQIQYNDGTNLAGSANLTFDVTSKTLTVDFISGDGYKLSNIAGANVAGFVPNANVANTAFSVSGANVTGTVANANYATYSGTAYSVSGANVTGTVANANYATYSGTAYSVSGANVSGEVAYANVANNVAGANVSGTVANATYAITAGTAYSVSGANVSGEVANANYATYSGTAYSVSGANVSGQVANALVAGTVYTNAQPNITSVGTLANLTVTGFISSGDLTVSGNLTVSGTTTTVNSTVTQIVDPIYELGGGANGAALSSDDGKDRGTLLHRYSGGSTIDSFIGWDNSNGEFALGSNVTIANNVITFNEYGALRAGNIYANNANFGGVVFANGNITTNGSFTGNLVGNVTGDVSGNISGNITVSGGAGSIQFADSSSKLTSSANLTFDSANAKLVVGGNSSTGLVSSDFLEGVLNSSSSSQPNITSVGTLTGFTSTGTVNLTGASNVSLGAVGNLHISGGSANYFLKTDGSGSLSWSALPSTTIAVDTYTGDGAWTMKTLSVTPVNINYTIVSIGGVFQPREAYDVTGAVITFDDPPPNGALVEITIINGGTAGSLGYVYQGINSSSTAIAGVRYLIDSSGGAVTLTLPASASLGDEVGVIDATGSASTNNITVARNGANIEGAASNMTISTNRTAFTLVYYNSTQGWVKTQK